MEVVVHTDLGGQGDAVVALSVIDTALARGGLSKLDLARCLTRAHELRRHLPYEYIKDYQRGNLYEQVARHLNSSLRSAQRYVRILDAPAEVQQAFARRQLALTQADRVAGLPAGKRAKFADALRAGEKPRSAFARYFPAPRGRHSAPAAAWRTFLQTLRAGLTDLDGRIEEVKALTPEDADLLDRAVEQLQAVREAAEVVSPQQQAAALQALHPALRPGQP